MQETKDLVTVDVGEKGSFKLSRDSETKVFSTTIAVPHTTADDHIKLSQQATSDEATNDMC